MNEENDAPYTKPQRRGYEQLVRKLLRMPGPPAIIQMHHYAWWRAHADGVEQGIFYFPQAEAQLYVFSQVRMQLLRMPARLLLAAACYFLQQGADADRERRAVDTVFRILWLVLLCLFEAMRSRAWCLLGIVPHN
jgi:hypothetical protein